ncbi:hypothetical protein E2C01_059586 [Portunus trituberculatus]|uniref:Secreted protein n=1 Tax=Portunus trituberculatus TaxID=210409 RepID=A0A5B7H2Z0_PORTR|nr:hypothetical protein [Portunus trituberculatus]
MDSRVLIGWALWSLPCLLQSRARCWLCPAPRRTPTAIIVMVITKTLLSLFFLHACGRQRFTSRIDKFAVQLHAFIPESSNRGRFFCPSAPAVTQYGILKHFCASSLTISKAFI